LLDGDHLSSSGIESEIYSSICTFSDKFTSNPLESSYEKKKIDVTLQENKMEDNALGPPEGESGVLVILLNCPVVTSSNRLPQSFVFRFLN
jgi:hypothetical protein